MTEQATASSGGVEQHTVYFDKGQLIYLSAAGFLGGVAAEGFISGDLGKLAQLDADAQANTPQTHAGVEAPHFTQAQLDAEGAILARLGGSGAVGAVLLPLAVWAGARHHAKRHNANLKFV